MIHKVNCSIEHINHYGEESQRLPIWQRAISTGANPDFPSIFNSNKLSFSCGLYHSVSTDEDSKRDKVLLALQDRIAKDGKFKATLTPVSNGGWKGKFAPAIRVKPVRLLNKKPYCGQHPVCDPAFAPKKKPNSTCLMWADWIKFNRLVNTVLNRYRVNADVWSNPLETKGKFHIRKGNKARVRYDYETVYNTYGRPIQIWDNGSDSQF